MADIFVCYRRKDSEAYAGRLYDRLKQAFGKNRVFIDVEKIRPGADFVDVIQSTLARARVVLVVIGPQWMVSEIDNPSDYVRKEIEVALNAGKHIIPVLVGGAIMPMVEQLPPSLAKLSTKAAVVLTHASLEDGFARLIFALRKELNRTGRLSKFREFLRLRLVWTGGLLALGTSTLVLVLPNRHSGTHADVRTPLPASDVRDSSAEGLVSVSTPPSGSSVIGPRATDSTSRSKEPSLKDARQQPDVQSSSRPNVPPSGSRPRDPEPAVYAFASQALVQALGEFQRGEYIAARRRLVTTSERLETLEKRFPNSRPLRQIRKEISTRMVEIRTACEVDADFREVVPQCT